jgi:hypothetical protein
MVPLVPNLDREPICAGPDADEAMWDVKKITKSNPGMAGGGIDCVIVYLCYLSNTDDRRGKMAWVIAASGRACQMSSS